MYELPVNYSDASSNFGVCGEILNNRITINVNIGNRSPELAKVFIFMDYTKKTE